MKIARCVRAVGTLLVHPSSTITRACFYAKRSTHTQDFEITGTLKSDGVQLSNFAELTHSFDQATVTAFAEICGDNNPLHIDPNFASTTIFKAPIVHGILVSSLFSTLFGRAINGSVYVSQSLSFKKPVHVGSTVVARMKILAMEERRSGTLLTCSTTCHLISGGGANNGLVLAVEGEAKVLLPKR